MGKKETSLGPSRKTQELATNSALRERLTGNSCVVSLRSGKREVEKVQGHQAGKEERRTRGHRRAREYRKRMASGRSRRNIA